MIRFNYFTYQLLLKEGVAKLLLSAVMRCVALTLWLKLVFPI